MNKYIESSKDILLTIDEQFGSKLLYKRRLKMISNKYQVMPDEKELDLTKIIITTKELKKKYEQCPMLIVCNDMSGVIKQVLAIDNSDESGFSPLIDDYIFQLHNNNIGIEIVARKTNFFNPMRGKQRGLRTQMPAYIGSVENNKKFCLNEIEYHDMQALVVPEDLNGLNLTNQLFFVFYHRGFLIREF